MQQIYRRTPTPKYDFNKVAFYRKTRKATGFKSSQLNIKMSKTETAVLRCSKEKVF